MKNWVAKMQFLPLVGIAFLQLKADATPFKNIAFSVLPANVLKKGCDFFISLDFKMN
jgi:hypothetical protein